MADINIGGTFHSTAEGHIVARANEIQDNTNYPDNPKKQSEINEDILNRVNDLEEDVGTGGSVDERIAEVVGDAGEEYNTLGKVEDKIQEEANTRGNADTTIQGNIDDINDAIGTDGTTGTVKGRIAALEYDVNNQSGTVDTRIDTAKSEVIGYASTEYNTLGKLEDQLQNLDNNVDQRLDAQDAEIALLNGSEVVIVADHTAVESPVANKIYREPEAVVAPASPTYYIDWMWDTTQTPPAWKEIAKYDFPGLDDEPTPGSQNLVKSGGVAASVVYDISAANSGATYADLAAALGTGCANIPASIRKGGMSIKFIQGSVGSSDNRYIQYRLMTTSFSTTESDWQGVDDEPTLNSNNLVKSSGIKKSIIDKGVSHIQISSGEIKGYYESNNTLIQAANTSCQKISYKEGVKKIKISSLEAGENVSIDAYDSNGTLVAIVAASSMSGVGDYELSVPYYDVLWINFFTNNATVEYDVNTYTDVVSEQALFNRMFSVGENLYDHSKLSIGTYINNSGIATIDADIATSAPIPIGANTNYYINRSGVFLHYIDTNGQRISTIIVSDAGTYTTPENTAYILISGGISTFNGLMVNLGTTAQDYVPYYLRVNTDFVHFDASNGKQPYQSGFIIFTVPVNQYIVDNTDDSNSIIDNEDSMANVDCVLKLPITYTQNGKPTKVIMICHGAGRSVYGDSTSWINISQYNALVNTFVNAGYAVFDCNGYANTVEGCNFWGAPKGVSAWRKAYDWVTQNYNVETNISIYGFSMGGLTAMNLICNNFPNVKCVALGSPVLNLQKCWDGNAQYQMELGYGYDTYTQELYAGNNPYGNIFEVDNVPYFRKQLPPLKIWYGATETEAEQSYAYVEKEDAKDVVSAIKNSDGTAYYREVSGRGHEICYGEIQFVNDEILLFINRFN